MQINLAGWWVLCLRISIFDSLKEHTVTVFTHFYGEIYHEIHKI